MPPPFSQNKTYAHQWFDNTKEQKHPTKRPKEEKKIHIQSVQFMHEKWFPYEDSPVLRKRRKMVNTSEIVVYECL